MALLMPVPFDEEQFNMITGANDRSNFYLEDDIEEVQDPSWLQTAGDRLGRLGRNTAEGLGMMFGGDATAIGGPDMSNQFPYNVWGSHVNAGGGMADAQGNIIPTEAVRGNWPITGESGTQITPKFDDESSYVEKGSPAVGMITQAETAPPPTSVAEAQARGEKTFWSNGQEKLAVTAEQLQAFKNSDAYDPTSGKNALSQWSEAWAPTSVETVSETVEASPRRDVRDILIEEEGLELTPYSDVGKTAIGVGHQLREGEEARDITEAEARETLESDIEEAYASVDRLAEKFDIDVLQPELRDELMMMAFQMGATGLSKFKKMWAGIRNQDWNEVVVQMADSRWAKSQTPERAARTINRVATLLGV